MVLYRVDDIRIDIKFKIRLIEKWQPTTWGFMQVGLDELSFSQLQVRSLARRCTNIFEH